MNKLGARSTHHCRKILRSVCENLLVTRPSYLEIFGNSLGPLEASEL